MATFWGERMKLEEQLKVISKEVNIYLSCGEEEYLGCKDSFLLGNVLLDKKVKSVHACLFIDNDEKQAVLHIELEEWKLNIESTQKEYMEYLSNNHKRYAICKYITNLKLKDFRTLE